jgi:hypothetical protein
VIRSRPGEDAFLLRTIDSSTKPMPTTSATPNGVRSDSSRMASSATPIHSTRTIWPCAIKPAAARPKPLGPRYPTSRKRKPEPAAACSSVFPLRSLMFRRTPVTRVSKQEPTTACAPSCAMRVKWSRRDQNPGVATTARQARPTTTAVGAGSLLTTCTGAEITTVIGIAPPRDRSALYSLVWPGKARCPYQAARRWTAPRPRPHSGGRRPERVRWPYAAAPAVKGNAPDAGLLRESEIPL